MKTVSILFVYLGSISACIATAIASSIRQQSILAGNDESSMVLYFKTKKISEHLNINYFLSFSQNAHTVTS